MSTVYLLHFERPIGSKRHHAQHYVGFTTRSIEERMEEHRATRWQPTGECNGAHLVGAANYNNIPFHVAQTWKGGRSLERKLKSTRNLKRYCPICSNKPRIYTPKGDTE